MRRDSVNASIASHCVSYTVVYSAYEGMAGNEDELRGRTTVGERELRIPRGSS